MRDITVVDLFSGAGGFSSGFKKSGYDILLANEIDPMIAETYKYNHEGVLMINEDIYNLSANFDEIVESNLSTIEDHDRKKDIKIKLDDVDVIIGGPPCQGFSMAGARIRKSNQFIDDPRNYLFKLYFQIIQRLEPKYFVLENVPGLKTMNDGKILNEIIRLFTDESNFKSGRYFLSKKIVSADELGVPQKRNRLIIIGSKFSKIDLHKEIRTIKKENDIDPNLTIRDAISDLNYLESGEGKVESEYFNEPLSKYQTELRANSNKLYNHKASRHNKLTLERIKKINKGENWQDLPEKENIKSVHSGAYGRLDWTSPAYTITTRFDTPSAGRVIHPERHRTLTAREAARLQSFDDDFIFLGNKTSIGKQIGNAVPPKVAKVLGDIIKKDLLKRE